ncbi:MAG: hypothetical protein Kapaf2KO_13550 [Candidatus Kapaibacteriales bacterium]
MFFGGLNSYAQPIYNVQNDVVIGSNAVGAASIITGAYLYLYAEDDSTGYKALNPLDIPIFDRMFLGYKSNDQELVSDILLYTLLTEAALINFKDPQKLRPLESPWIPVFFTTTGLNLITKTAFRRYRPYAYDTLNIEKDLKNKDASFSFYSGHTTESFSAAVYSSMMYEFLDYPSQFRGLVWLINLSAATATGILRIGSGNHFPSDVLVGAIVGSAIGWLGPTIYNRYSVNSSLQLNNEVLVRDYEVSAMNPSFPLIRIPISL